MPDETRVIEPALTGREWIHEHGTPVVMRDRFYAAVEFRRTRYGGRPLVVGEGDETTSIHENPAHLFAIMALANAALPDGDPRKITREDILAARQAAHLLAEQREGMLSTKWPENENPWRELAPRLRDLADRLAALMPAEA